MVNSGPTHTAFRLMHIKTEVEKLNQERYHAIHEDTSKTISSHNGSLYMRNTDLICTVIYIRIYDTGSDYPNILVLFVCINMII